MGAPCHRELRRGRAASWRQARQAASPQAPAGPRPPVAAVGKPGRSRPLPLRGRGRWRKRSAWPAVDGPPECPSEPQGGEQPRGLGDADARNSPDDSLLLFRIPVLRPSRRQSPSTGQPAAVSSPEIHFWQWLLSPWMVGCGRRLPVICSASDHIHKLYDTVGLCARRFVCLPARALALAEPYRTAYLCARSLPAPSAVRAAGSQSAPLRARFVYWTFRARPCPFFLAILSYSTEECTVCRRPPGWAQDAAS
jgi:hypothetical protein